MAAADPLSALHAAETAHFSAANPASAALAERAAPHFLHGVPMHWMRDWPLPFPLAIRAAEGCTLHDADGHALTDFCLGDTGAMFGHSPPAIADALIAQAGHGLTTMLPDMRSAAVGAALAARFGLEAWQLTATASDANRHAIRWARALTRRPVLLVFDGCYHGSVEDTLVRQGADGATLARAGLVGQVAHPAPHTRVVPFNDVDALERALAPGDVAAVLTEPALTNIGMVPPLPGFHEALRALTRRHGSLLILDETHTLSSGPGGATQAWGLEPDLLTLGKAVAGGFPCGVLGMRAPLARRAEAWQPPAGGAGGHGHSGMGTTLSGNPVAIACLEAALAELHTEATYARMFTAAGALQAGIEALLARHRRPWCVTRIGARLEIQFRPTPPRTGAEAEQAFDDALQACIHLALVNRGVVVTPFHHMLLASPATGEAQVAHFLAALDAVLGLLEPVRP